MDERTQEVARRRYKPEEIIAKLREAEVRETRPPSRHDKERLDLLPTRPVQSSNIVPSRVPAVDVHQQGVQKLSSRGYQQSVPRISLLTKPQQEHGHQGQTLDSRRSRASLWRILRAEVLQDRLRLRREHGVIVEFP